jgi:hypothetical protein
MGIQYSELDDAVLLTQENLIKKGAFLDMQTDLTEHVAVREIWKGRKKAFEGGNDWRFDAQIDHNHSAKAVKMYETDGSAMSDTMIKGYMQPRHVNAHYIYDKREPAFQKGGKAIVDLVQTKYTGMMVSFYELLEDMLWGSPAASDDITPHGISFWIQKGTAGQEGFYGLDPSGYEAVGRAHILSSAQPRWANWFADYATISKEDLIRKMRKAHRKTKFVSPLSHSQPDLNADTKNGIYTNDAVIGLIEEELEKQNMNLGTDIDSMGGRAAFKGKAFTYVPKIDDDTTNPLYMLDWRWIALGTMPGWENNLTAPYMVPNMHLVSRVDLDATLEMICTNLRRQSVFAQVV